MLILWQNCWQYVVLFFVFFFFEIFFLLRKLFIGSGEWEMDLCVIQESSNVNNGPFSFTGEETPKDVRTSTVVYETERERAREREGGGVFNGVGGRF